MTIAAGRASRGHASFHARYAGGARSVISQPSNEIVNGLRHQSGDIRAFMMISLAITIAMARWRYRHALFYEPRQEGWRGICEDSSYSLYAEMLMMKAYRWMMQAINMMR